MTQISVEKKMFEELLDSELAMINEKIDDILARWNYNSVELFLAHAADGTIKEAEMDAISLTNLVDKRDELNKLKIDLEKDSSTEAPARHEQNTTDMILPIPIPGEEVVQERFAGNYIATQDGKIVAIDRSLRGLHEKCKAFASSGKGCHIEYVEDGATVYGLGV